MCDIALGINRMKKTLLFCLMLVFLTASVLLFAPMVKTAKAEQVFSDDFSDVGATAWTQQQGNWTVANGVYNSSALGAENAISTIQTSLTDYTVETKLKFTDALGFRAGIVFRYLDNSQYYSFELSNEYDCLIFCKYLHINPYYGTQDATWAAANRIVPPPQIYFEPGAVNSGVEYTLKLVVSGSTFTGYLTGGGLSETLTWTDSSYSTGTVGLRMRAAAASFDYFQISNENIPISSPTPTPTPSLPPNALEPTLDISCKSTTSYSGFKVQIEGNLHNASIPLIDQPVLLSYSVTGGNTWQELTLTHTVSDGSYFAEWRPSVTGDYLIKAVFNGNDEYPQTTSVVNLAVTSYAEQNTFSVSSNSTITNLFFNSTSKELCFSVTGDSGTHGYSDVYIAKSLIADSSDINVLLDGFAIDKTVTSSSDSWLLHFTYSHSTHDVVIDLGGTSGALASVANNWLLPITVGLGIVVAIVLGIALKRRKK